MLQRHCTINSAFRNIIHSYLENQTMFENFRHKSYKFTNNAISTKPLKKVLHIQSGGQYLPQCNIFCCMSYLIMEAWLSSFPMIPISLVYSFSGMNDSFMNGVGVPSVKCQISISAGIGGPYLPQYNSVLLHVLSYYGSLVIQLSHDPNIIGVQFQWDE